MKHGALDDQVSILFCNSIWDHPDSSLDMGHPFSCCTNNTIVIFLIEKSDLDSICNGLVDVPSNTYDDIPFKLKYPTIDLVVEHIKEIGPSAKLFKVDLECAFRNLRVDPYEYRLMGLRWNNDVYVDVGITFSFKMEAAAFQMCTMP